MSNAIILDGTAPGQVEPVSLLAFLRTDLARRGMQESLVHLRDVRLAHCIGCFGCWLETPGICRESDAGREIARAIIQSSVLFLVTPVTFGGYSSEIKKALERCVPLVLPYFAEYYGDIHHLPRYSRYPRLAVIGIQRRPDASEARLFKAVVARNAINLHSSHHAVEMVTGAESPEKLRRIIDELLSRNDSVVTGQDLSSWSMAPDTPPAGSPAADSRRALLIVGSPKTKSASTSGVLGGYLMQKLEASGWEVETVRLKASLRRKPDQDVFLSQVDSAGLIVTAFPLYVDTLPYLVTKAFEIIAAHRRAVPYQGVQRFVAIANNGFPEARQNTLALAICRRFAWEAGMVWSGGLGMGAGEAISSGVPLTGPKRAGRPPVKHVIRALDLTGESLAAGQPVPNEAVTLIAKNPIPFLPYKMWRWLFLKAATRNWNQTAAAKGINPEQMLAKPYGEH